MRTNLVQMKIGLKELKEKKELFLNYTETETIATEELKEFNQIKDIYPLEVALHLVWESGEISGQGTVRLKANLYCSNCLGTFPLQMELGWDFTIFEKDLADQNLDLTEELRQLVLLNLPAYPRCRSDCLGLCPQCGKNLNRENCSCEKQNTDSPFAILKKIKLLKRGKNA